LTVDFFLCGIEEYRQ